MVAAMTLRILNARLALAQVASYDQASSPGEAAAFKPASIFGMHSVFCAFHASGPCTLAEVEAGVSVVWANNYSKGYHPLMDTNIMLWASSIGPLLDALLRDGIDFYPMVWQGEHSDV